MAQNQRRTYLKDKTSKGTPWKRRGGWCTNERRKIRQSERIDVNRYGEPPRGGRIKGEGTAVSSITVRRCLRGQHVVLVQWP